MGIVSRLFGRKSRLRLAGGGCIQLTDMLARSGSWEATNRNVVRLDKRGRVVWRIETDASPDERIPYTHISFKSGVLTAYSWSGGEYDVDLDTGEISNGRLVK